MRDALSMAVLGAGSTMGRAMARNIARAGMPVRAWNRTRDKALALEDDGIDVFESAAESAEGAGVILTMLSDADAVLAVIAEAAAGAAKGTVWLQMSTIGEAGTEGCAPRTSLPASEGQGDHRAQLLDPSFRLGLAAKDAGLIEESAGRHAVDVPLFATIHRRLEAGAREHGDEHLSATYLTIAPDRSYSHPGC